MTAWTTKALKFITAEILDLLYAVVHPRTWIIAAPYNRDWDASLKEAMITNRFIRLGEHTAKLGRMEIWIANHPYASFTLHRPWPLEVRPSRRTVGYAYRRYLRDILQQASSGDVKQKD